MSSSDEDEYNGRKRFDPQQVEILEIAFRFCPHPDERQRIELSRRTGLNPDQIKFWCQNKRTYLKAKHNQLSNSFLHAENEKIRCEIIEMQMALKNCACSKCGVPLYSQEEDEWLRKKSEHVKAEIDKCLAVITNKLGSSFAEMSLTQLSLDPVPTAEPLNRSYVSSLDIDALSNISTMNAPPPLSPINTPISNNDKASLIEQATNAMEELIELVRSTDGLWIKPLHEDTEILDLRNYRKTFKKIDYHFPDQDLRLEASRASGVVCMNPLALVDMFMDPAKWADLFQTVVSKANIIDILSVGMGGNNHSGSLLLIHSDIGIPSPLIPSRKDCFVRYCLQVKSGFWFITDVSVKLSGYSVKNRRLPSGCLIQEMPNGHSKVTWVEHLEVEENNQNLGVFKKFIHSGMAFGAQRWLATLQRMSERFYYMLMPVPQNMDTGVILTQRCKRSMMTLSHSMVKSFCNSLCPGNDIQQWFTLLDANEILIRVLPHQIVDNVGPNGIVLNAITSTWLPFSTERIFDFFKDESKRDMWDILSTRNIVQPITTLCTGFNVGNCISLLRAVTPDGNPVTLLQETFTDSSISMLVYASIDNPSMEVVMNEGETSNISLIPSGVAILPNRSSSVSMGPSSSSNPTIAGSFLTLSFKFLMNNQSAVKLDQDMLMSLKGMMSEALQNVKRALNIP